MIDGVDTMVSIVSNQPSNASLPFVWTPLKKFAAQSGTKRTPNANIHAVESIILSLLCHESVPKMRTPETKTFAKRKLVTPPKTGFGIDKKTPDIFPSIPNKMR